jgi:hypothetical protein
MVAVMLRIVVSFTKDRVGSTISAKACAMVPHIATL